MAARELGEGGVGVPLVLCNGLGKAENDALTMYNNNLYILIATYMLSLQYDHTLVIRKRQGRSRRGPITAG